MEELLLHCNNIRSFPISRRHDRPLLDDVRLDVRCRRNEMQRKLLFRYEFPPRKKG